MTPRRVLISFHRRFDERLLNHRKLCTTRCRQIAHPGDWFVLLEHTFVVDKVTKCYLGKVASRAYQCEGFDSEHDFIKFWNECYPQRRYNPNSVVFWHRFYMEK